MINIEFTIPRATPVTALYRQVFDLGVNARGIKSIDVTIPPGHKGLVYMRAYTPTFLILPSFASSSQFIRGDDQIINAQVNRRVEGPPFNLICEGYNLDSFLSHAFILNISEF